MGNLNLYTWVIRRSFRKLGERSPTFLGTCLSIDTLVNRLPLSETVLNRIRMTVSEIVRLKYQNFDPDEVLFKRVQIQTRTGCNLSCPFCPANKKGIILPKGQMSVSLFKKILKELSDLKFCGVIHLYLQNEPLLDPRLEEFTRISRELCPNASVVIETNGTFLDSKRLRSLVDSGMDVIYVNNYTNDNILQRFKPLGPQYTKHLILNQQRSWNEELTNRAGNVPGSKSPTSTIQAFCVRPYDQLYIGYDGRVLLCCQDWGFQEIMGDLSRESILEIWNNEKYRAVRESLLHRDRSKFICENCDFQGWP